MHPCNESPLGIRSSVTLTYTLIVLFLGLGPLQAQTESKATATSTAPRPPPFLPDSRLGNPCYVFRSPKTMKAFKLYISIT